MRLKELVGSDLCLNKVSSLAKKRADLRPIRLLPLPRLEIRELDGSVSSEKRVGFWICFEGMDDRIC